MRTLDKKQDKVQKICDTLKRETLEPAKEAAEKLLADAQARAQHIIAEAETEAKKIIAEGRLAIEQERNVFHSSLGQASRQTLETLKQAIEQKLFSETLVKAVNEETTKPNVIGTIITALVTAIEREGISTDITAIIPRTVSTADVNNFLAKETLNKLKEQSVVLGAMTGGAKVKLHDKRITLEISDQVLSQFLSNYVRKDFRQWLFGKDEANA